MAEVVTVESSDEGEENSIDLTAEECEERCQAFVEITGTDSALAMFYLQDREWDVKTSLNAYFQSQGEGANAAAARAQKNVSSSTKNSHSSESEALPKPNQQLIGDGGTSSSSSSSSSTTTPPTQAKCLTTAPPVLQTEMEGQVRVLSWNIDGIDPDNLQSRTQGVCGVLKQENPEVIFLQEVVQRSLVILESEMTNYTFYKGYDDPRMLSLGAYFTVLLVRKDCVVTDNVKLTDFPTTKMERNLLEVQCCIKSVPVTLMTSHLESTAEYTDERRRQLKIGFDRMKKCSVGTTAIFGGDLNLRDKEVTGASAKPHGIYDMWECTGKRPEAKYTWDLTRNDNKQFHSKFQPRCRFDRMFIAHPKDEDDKINKAKVRLKPVYFELVGIQRLASCQRFPSDHWGILSHLTIVN